MNSPRIARINESISVFVFSFSLTLSSTANTGRVKSAFNPCPSSKRTAALDPRPTNSRTAGSTSSGGNAFTPYSGRSNDAIILNRSICSPADDARPKTCRPVGISRCSISCNCSYSSKTRASRCFESISDRVSQLLRSLDSETCLFPRVMNPGLELVNSFGVTETTELTARASQTAPGVSVQAAASLHSTQILFAYRRR